MKNKTLSVIVDPDIELTKNAFSSSVEQMLCNQGGRVLQMELKTLTNGLNEHVLDLTEAISKLDTSNCQYVVDTISFT